MNKAIRFNEKSNDANIVNIAISAEGLIVLKCDSSLALFILVSYISYLAGISYTKCSNHSINKFLESADHQKNLILKPSIYKLELDCQSSANFSLPSFLPFLFHFVSPRQEIFSTTANPISCFLLKCTHGTV